MELIEKLAEFSVLGATKVSPLAVEISSKKYPINHTGEVL
jgi:hypothetical protein